MTREELKRSIVADMERNEFLASLWSNVKRKYKKTAELIAFFPKTLKDAQSSVRTGVYIKIANG